MACPARQLPPPFTRCPLPPRAQDTVAALRHKLAAVQRELSNATEEEYSRLAARSAAAAAAPAGGLQLTVDVDSLVREIQQQHAPKVVQHHAPPPPPTPAVQVRSVTDARCGTKQVAFRAAQLPASAAAPIVCWQYLQHAAWDCVQACCLLLHRCLTVGAHSLLLPLLRQMLSSRRLPPRWPRTSCRSTSSRWTRRPSGRRARARRCCCRASTGTGATQVGGGWGPLMLTGMPLGALVWQ